MKERLVAKNFDHLTACCMAVFAVHGAIFGTCIALVRALSFDTSDPGEFLTHVFCQVVISGFVGIAFNLLIGLFVATATSPFVVMTKSYAKSQLPRQAAAVAATLATSFTYVTRGPSLTVPLDEYWKFETEVAFSIASAAVMAYFAIWYAMRPRSEKQDASAPSTERRQSPENFSHFVGWVAGLQIIQGVVFGAWMEVTRTFGGGAARHEHYVIEFFMRALFAGFVIGLVYVFVGLIIAGLTSPLVARVRASSDRWEPSFFAAGIAIAVTLFFTRYVIGHLSMPPQDLWKLQFVGIVNVIAAGVNTFIAAWKGSRPQTGYEPAHKISVFDSSASQSANRRFRVRPTDAAATSDTAKSDDGWHDQKDKDDDGWLDLTV